MNRRTALIGLGTIVFGGSVVLGTGAFSSAEQERTVTIATTGDAAGFLGLEPTGEWTDQFVDDDGDRIEIDITGTEEDDGFTGVNEDSNTTLTELVQVTNQGTIDIQTLDAGINGESGENELLTTVEEFATATPLSPTESTTFGIEIELRKEEVDDSVPAYDDDDGGLTAEFDPTVEIIAETDDSL